MCGLFACSICARDTQCACDKKPTILTAHSCRASFEKNAKQTSPDAFFSKKKSDNVGIRTHRMTNSPGAASSPPPPPRGRGRLQVAMPTLRAAQGRIITRAAPPGCTCTERHAPSHPVQNELDPGLLLLQQSGFIATGQKHRPTRTCKKRKLTRGCSSISSVCCTFHVSPRPTYTSHVHVPRPRPRTPPRPTYTYTSHVHVPRPTSPASTSNSLENSGPDPQLKCVQQTC